MLWAADVRPHQSPRVSTGQGPLELRARPPAPTHQLPGVGVLPLPPPRASLWATVLRTGIHARHTSPGLQELTKLNAPRYVLGQTHTPRLPGASCPGSWRTTPGREGLDRTGRGGLAVCDAACRVQASSWSQRASGQGARHRGGQMGDMLCQGLRARPAGSLCRL